MARVTDHEDLAELLGAYALDAVDGDEAELLERHLQACPRCRAELVEHREVAGLLGFAGQEAPVGLWDRIVDSMQAPPPALRLQTSEQQWTPAPGSPTEGDNQTMGRRAHRRSSASRRGFRTRSVAVMAAAASVAVALLAVQVVRLDHRTGQLNREMTVAAMTPSMTAVHQALKNAGAHKVVLTSLNGGQASLDAVILPNGQGYVYNSKLSPLTTDQTYQLWGVEGADRVSYGILGGSVETVEAFRAVPNVQALAVTAEVAGGVVQSTHAPVAVGSVGSAPA